MKESNTQKELSRVPRTLSESSNTKVLEVLFDAGGTVMSDIIIYVASSQMKICSATAGSPSTIFVRSWGMNEPSCNEN